MPHYPENKPTLRIIERQPAESAWFMALRWRLAAARFTIPFSMTRLTKGTTAPWMLTTTTTTANA